MTVTLDKSKGTCVGNDNRDLPYRVRLILLQVLNLIKKSIRICDFGKYALFLGDSVGHVVSALDLQSGMFQSAIRRSQVPL